MVTVEADPVHVESRLAAGDRLPDVPGRCLGRLGVCPGPADRGAQRSAAAAAGALPGLRGYARVVAGDGAVAQSVCGGTDLGRVDRPRRGIWASPDRREPGYSGGDGAWLAASRRVAAGGGSGLVSGCGSRCRGGREDPRRDGLCVARRVGRGGDRDRRDPLPLRCGRVAGRGDARSGSGRGQWWSAAGTGMVAASQLRLRNTNRP